jgi:serine/threonine protein kinase
MGTVWQAVDQDLGRPVAVKLLRQVMPDEIDLAARRAMREAQNTALVNHPHAVALFDVVEHDGSPCLILQFIASKPLATLLRQDGPLEPIRAAEVGAQVGSALAAAHALDITHRDVKPGNILIDDHGSAFISDFGISHLFGDVTLTATGVVHGSLPFMSPEAARGAQTTPASDVFSLGSTLYAALEGEPPFGTNQNLVQYKMSEWDFSLPTRSGPLHDILLAMLSRNSQDRPSMSDVATDLTKIATPPSLTADLVTTVVDSSQPAIVAGDDRLDHVLTVAATTALLDRADQPTTTVEDDTEDRVVTASATAALVDHDDQPDLTTTHPIAPPGSRASRPTQEDPTRLPPQPRPGRSTFEWWRDVVSFEWWKVGAIVVILVFVGVGVLGAVVGKRERQREIQSAAEYSRLAESALPYVCTRSDLGIRVGATCQTFSAYDDPLSIYTGESEEDSQSMTKCPKVVPSDNAYSCFSTVPAGKVRIQFSPDFGVHGVYGVRVSGYERDLNAEFSMLPRFDPDTDDLAALLATFNETISKLGVPVSFS